MSGHRLGLGRSSRLHGRSQFRAVFAGRLRKSIGPLTVCVRANDLAFNRFGLSVPRAVGTAVQRNRVKRLLREALRLKHADVLTAVATTGKLSDEATAAFEQEAADLSARYTA